MAGAGGSRGGQGSKNLIGQHLAPEELGSEDSTACVVSLLSLSFVSCHQEMQ